MSSSTVKVSSRLIVLPEVNPMEDRTEWHELLVLYEGPFNPLVASECANTGKNRKAFCIRLPSCKISHNPNDGKQSSSTCHIKESDVLSSLSIKIGWPASMLYLRHSSSLLFPSHCLQLDKFTTVHQHEIVTAGIRCRHSAILGGKGGFGTLLKGQSKQAGARTTLDFGACRDLSGRRLRHVNDEIKLQKFRALQAARERGENVDEMAALKTESGIRNWHLMVPHWSEGAILSAKGRRRTERQLEREILGWQSEKKRIEQSYEQKKSDEERAVTEYVRRGEVEGARISTSTSDDVKAAILAHLRTNKKETRSLEYKKEQLDIAKNDSNTTLAASLAGESKSGERSLMSHLMALSGEMLVFDIPDEKDEQSKQSNINKQQSGQLRLQSQSDFATAVIFLDASKLASSALNISKGVYIEFTIQTAGLSQIGWVHAPSSVSGCSINNNSASFLPNSDTGDGVGDDSASFGYDGSRGLKLHGGKELSYGHDQKQKKLEWKVGDIIGCWCKLVYKKAESKTYYLEVGYSLNGSDLGVAFSESTPNDTTFEYYPAVSQNFGEIIDVNVGPDFSFSVKDGCVGAFAFMKIDETIEVKSKARSSACRTTNNPEMIKISSEDNAPPPKKVCVEEIQNASRVCSDMKVDKCDKITMDFTEGMFFDLNECESIDELMKMSPDTLKNILFSMGVKCGGRPDERARRLFSLKGLRKEEYPINVRGKNFTF